MRTELFQTVLLLVALKFKFFYQKFLYIKHCTILHNRM